MEFKLPTPPSDTQNDNAPHARAASSIPHEYTHQLMEEQDATYHTHPFGNMLQQEIKAHVFGYSQRLLDLQRALTIEVLETGTRVTLLYVLEGQLLFHLQGQDPLAVSHGEHLSLYMPKKETCRVNVPEGRHLIAQVYIPLTLIRLVARHHRLFHSIIGVIDRKTPGFFPLLRKRNTPAILQALTSLRHCPRQEPSKVLRLRAKTYDLMQKHLTAPDAAGPGFDSVISQMHAVRSLILQDLSVHHTTGALAHHFGFSERNLARLFQQVFSESILQFTLDQRMKLAMDLLTKTPMTLQAIYLQVGYNDLSDFTRIFTKHFGSSPHHFRKI